MNALLRAADRIGLHLHDPRLFTREGADHTGKNAFLRCSCGLRTEAHFECVHVTNEVRDFLEREWNAKRRTIAEFVGT